MSEMVERVMAALVAQMQEDEKQTSVFYGDDGQGTYMKRLARAAISAMREPTEKMTETGDNAAGSLAITHDYSAKFTWQCMIDEALKE